MLNPYISRIRDYFISGLLILIPLYITLLLIRFIMDLLDSTFHWLPEAYRPDKILHFSYSGVVITLLVFFLTGWANYKFSLTNRVVNYWDILMSYIPIIGTIHSITKKILNKLLPSQKEVLTKVYLLEFPIKGMWTIGFEVGSMFSLPIPDELVCIFILMTPNITAGFLILVPKKQAIELNMNLDSAIKYVVSLGILE